MKLVRNIKYSAIAFSRSSKSTGILLLLFTFLSLILTNISIGDRYLQFWNTPSSFLHHLKLPNNVLEWINDGFMSLFFLLAGMEIKRELLVGELNSSKKALLPLIGAVGGVAFPAIIFALFCKGTPFISGWGIPTATDIAFSMGIVSILGKKIVSNSLKIFLTALAIIDDLIAILIVAFFYGGTMNWFWLLISGCLLAAIWFYFKRVKKVNVWAIILGILFWFSVFQSGIHATMAGVLFGILIPINNIEYVEKKLHSTVNLVIIPVFACANTCIPLNVNIRELVQQQHFWGISLGLFLGKVGGIALCSYTIIKSKWAALPSGVNWSQFIGACILGGIGFTMSIFIASLAFDNIKWLNEAKIAILVGSFASMIVGFLWFKFIARRKKVKKPLILESSHKQNKDGTFNTRAKV